MAKRTISLPKRPSDPPEIVNDLGLEQMTLQEISPECGQNSPNLLFQLVAVCSPRKAELNWRRVDQSGYVRDAGLNESGPNVELVPEWALQQDFPRGLRFGWLHLLDVE
ncbi:unnamed protein product [Prorocentrum cordatum]|uniref:Uncharacterized protein n=1 Tax=Prorocentrum cordatum TaxID=2364126 RepID=A0ABN9WGB1_9DINO|nr:unnamed protein product [Polarella glacialis]